VGGQGLLQRIAEAAEHLQLDVRVLAARQAVVGQGVGHRPEVVRGDRQPHPAGELRVDEPLGELLEVAVAVGFDLEDRHAPAVLLSVDDLVVPVGALDQPDGQRMFALGAGAGAHPLEDGVERLRRIAQVGLQHHSR
jgi:hypothetical protein